MITLAIAGAIGRRFIIRRSFGWALFYFWPPSRFISFPEICRGDPAFTDQQSLNCVHRKKIVMIKMEIISPDTLRILVLEKLKVDDFSQIAPQVDSTIRQHGKIRLIIDASQFKGWENIAAFENHAGFVKGHQNKVERIAVIVAHD